MEIVIKEVDITVTPKEVANIISNYDSREQVVMLNELARILNDWNNPYVFQLQHITDDNKLTDKARRLMEYIGDYSGNKESEL